MEFSARWICCICAGTLESRASPAIILGVEPVPAHPRRAARAAKTCCKYRSFHSDSIVRDQRERPREAVAWTASPLDRAHVEQELRVVPRLAQLVHKKFHGLNRRERVEHLAQHPDALQI